MKTNSSPVTPKMAADLSGVLPFVRGIDLSRNDFQVN